VVEGPLAGGHLGFGLDDWFNYDLKAITLEVLAFLKQEGLKIPVLPAGGIFTGSDAVEMMEIGAAGIQAATRFTVTRESGLPDKVKQAYFAAREEDVVVNAVSPTGYPMRMLRQSPCIGAGIKPNCESMGYVLDREGKCSYIDAYERARAEQPDNVAVWDKTCLCTHMRAYNTWTCGHTASRLKETTHPAEGGSYQVLTVADVFNDYMFSTDQQILLPKKA